MKYLKKCVLVLVVPLFFFSCKKKDPEPVKDMTIKYPIIYNDMLNVLSDSSFVLTSSKEYSLAATLPTGTSLKVIFKPSKGNSLTGYIAYTENDGWTCNKEHFNDSMVLTATGSDKTVNINYMTGPPGSMDFFIYENGSDTPTRTKVVKNF